MHGKSPIEIYVHVLLVWSIVGCFVFSVLEFFDRHQILFTYGRILFTILQGTWFFQVGFMLYPPSDAFPVWDMNDHGAVMLIAVAYCWHIMLIFVGLAAQLCLVKLVQKLPLDRFKCDELIYMDNLNSTDEHTAHKLDYKFDANGKMSGQIGETRFLTVNSDDDDDDDDDSGLNETVIFNKN